MSFENVENRLSGFFGGGLIGLVLGVLGVVAILNFSTITIPLNLVFYGLIGSIILFAIAGTIWPKWFAWAFDILMSIG